MNNQSIEQTFFRQFYQDVQSPDVDENLLQIIEKCKGLQPLQFAAGSNANFCNFSTRNTKAIPDDIFDKFEEFLFQEQLRNLKKLNPKSIYPYYKDAFVALQDDLKKSHFTLKDKEKMLLNPKYGEFLQKIFKESPGKNLLPDGAGTIYYSRKINFRKTVPTHRLYINVDGKASLDFVKIFIQNFDANNLPYVIKNTLTDKDGQTRSDLVVIYLDDMTLKYGINLCEHIKEKVPSIANSIDNPPVLTGKYHGWIGYGFEISKSNRSFNQTMSDILFTSVGKGLGKEALSIYNNYMSDYDSNKSFFTNFKKHFLTALTTSTLKFNADCREYINKYNPFQNRDYKKTGLVVTNPNDPALFSQVYSYFSNTLSDEKINEILSSPFKHDTIPSTKLYVPQLGEVSLIVSDAVIISALCKLSPYIQMSNPNFLETIKQEIPKAIAEYKNRYPEFEKSGLHFDPGKICFAATDEQYHNRYGNDSHLPQGPLKHKKEHEKAKFMSNSDIAILKDNNNLYVAGEKQLLNESLYKKFLQSYKFNKILFYPVTKNKKNIIKIGDSIVSFVCKDGTNYKIDGNLAKFFEIKNPQNIKPKVATNEITTNAQKKDFKIIPKGGVAVFNYDNSLYVIGEEMMDTVQEYLTHNYIFKSGLFYKISPSKNNVIKIGDIQFSITNEREGYKITGNGIEDIDIVSKPNKNK